MTRIDFHFPARKRSRNVKAREIMYALAKAQAQ